MSLTNNCKIGALWLTVVGGLNWGLVGLLDWDLVQFIFHAFPGVVRGIYILVGLSALYLAFNTIFPSSSWRN